MSKLALHTAVVMGLTAFAWIGCGSDPGSSGSGGAGGSGMPIGQPPTAKINHPGDMEMRAANMPIPFIGVGTDPEDGALSGASLVWTSDLSGKIGVGEQFDAPLTAGKHVITLTVTDSDRNTGTAAITLDVQ